MYDVIGNCDKMSWLLGRGDRFGEVAVSGGSIIIV